MCRGYLEGKVNKAERISQGMVKFKLKIRSMHETDTTYDQFTTDGFAGLG